MSHSSSDADSKESQLLYNVIWGKGSKIFQMHESELGVKIKEHLRL